MPVDRPPKRRFVILISGQGSNMREIVQHCRTVGAPADFVRVISNQPDAPGLAWALAQGIPTGVISHRDFGSREAFDGALAQAIAESEPDYVLLAGFMRILTSGFVARFEQRLVNIHPSLLPAFPGLHTHAQALNLGVAWHGCTVHFVTDQLDHGPIISQAALPVREGETVESLAARVLRLEHQLYPRVAQWLAEGRVSMTVQGRVHVNGVQDRHFWSAV